MPGLLHKAGQITVLPFFFPGFGTCDQFYLTAVCFFAILFQIHILTVLGVPECPYLELSATDAGRPLYEKPGFDFRSSRYHEMKLALL